MAAAQVRDRTDPPAIRLRCTMMMCRTAMTERRFRWARLAVDLLVAAGVIAALAVNAQEIGLPSRLM